MSRTDLRAFAIWMAREHDVVVLPTPPLPPTKIQRRDFWSMMVWREGVGSSDMVVVVEVGCMGGCVGGEDARKMGWKSW